LQSLINITSGASHLSSSSTTSSSAASLTSSSVATTTTTTTATYSDVLNSNLDYWKKMRDKFETVSKHKCIYIMLLFLYFFINKLSLII
jgi:hypothetical protein